MIAERRLATETANAHISKPQAGSREAPWA